MKLSSRVIAIALNCVLISLSSFAQMIGRDSLKTIPVASGKYLFPVRPGQPNHLAGTMGELRSTHFHGGIDIRTNNQTGVPILATQRGFVSRVSCTTSGYGNAIYITHPDGNTSVYGHLDRIKGPLDSYVRAEKYKKKVSEINILFQPIQFPVKQGDTIGYSGNTGSSGGPHLHFEIRDDKNNSLNPLSFGFSEIRDNLAPTAQKIALKTLDIHSRINGTYGRFEFYLQKSGNQYTLPFPIYATGNIGVELLAIDRMDESHFKFGINYIEMQTDSQLVFSQTIDKVPIEDTRGILALMDYRAFKLSGQTFNKMFIDDGNTLPFYNPTGNGKICMGDKDLPVKLLLRDFRKNTSTVTFTLRPEAESKKVFGLDVMTLPYEYEALDNVLKVSVKPCLKDSTSSLRIFEKGKVSRTEVSYADIHRNVYLIDLQKALPDSILTCSGSIVLNYQDRIPSGLDYKYYSDRADVQFQKNSLYDTLFARVFYEPSVDSAELFTISNTTIPLFRAATVTLKPLRAYPDKTNTTVYRKVNNRYSYVGGRWEQDRILFATTELGTFTIRQDKVPPVITKMSVTATSARFRIRDAMSGLASFEATINGEWLLMTYDYKSGIIFSERLDPKKLLKGDFVLKVVDNAGNERIFKQKIL